MVLASPRPSLGASTPEQPLQFFAFKYTCEKNMLQVNMARLLGIMQLHPVIDDELPYQEFAKNKDTTYYSCDFPMFFIFSFFGGVPLLTGANGYRKDWDD